MCTVTVTFADGATPTVAEDLRVASIPSCIDIARFAAPNLARWFEKDLVDFGADGKTMPCEGTMKKDGGDW